jgi:ERCC4-related helicase
MLQGFTPRLYQETILETTTKKNTLVVLPTGMGKTGVALLLCAQRLTVYPQSKIIMLAPTKPLAEQHLQTFKKHLELPEEQLALFTGDIPPEKRAAQFLDARVIFSTPQGLENDIISGNIDLSKVCLMIFDEAHRATGDYSYVFIAKHYQKKASYPRILALSASPGSDLLKIEDICKNLGIEAVEIRTEKDPDVSPYIQEVEMTWVKVQLPEEFLRIKKLLDECIREKTMQLREIGVKTSIVSKKDLIFLQKELQAKMAEGRDISILRGLSILAEIMKAHHALELLESQGITPAHKYMADLFEQAGTTNVKAVKNLTTTISFKSAYILTQKLKESGAEHPKLPKLCEIIKEQFEKDKFAKIILFTQFRDTAVKLCEELKKINGALPQVFVGQAKKSGTGLSQKQQIEMLSQFKDGLFNILIATSVAEEGLDIPKVDTVIFYEPIPSAIRHIQRRGRTGRNEKGQVIIFMTQKTREEAYSFSSKIKEQKMHHALDTLKKQLIFKSAPTQPTLEQYNNTPNITIFADYREKSTGTVKALADLGITLKLDMLKCADYVLSQRCGVELKTTEDFVSSIIDGRLLEQLKSLKQNFERPLIIIQGTQDIYAVRNVHPNAIRGMLATIAVSYGIPIIYSKDEKDSAAILLSIAKREQESEKRDFSPHADRKPMTMKEQQEYLVSCLPNIGPNLSRELLKHFGSVKNVMDASLLELQKVEGVGEKKAQAIRELIDKEYS